MAIKREKQGDGITEKEIVSWNDAEDASVPEIASLLEVSTLEGLIEAVEQECFSIMAEAELPTQYGWYWHNAGGDWSTDMPEQIQRGCGNTSDLYKLAALRGYGHDSSTGFAARMLSDTYWLRQHRDSGSHERACLFAYYLGVKRAELRIKRVHERKWRAGDALVRGGKDSRKGLLSAEERMAEVDRLVAEGKSKTAAFSIVAEGEGVTAKAIDTEYYKTKKKVS